MATKHTINKEDLVLSGDSTIEYGGSSSENESDCSTDEYPSSIASRSTGDIDDSDGLSGSGDEGVIEIDGDNGNFANDTWRFMEADYSTDGLLDCYPFSPLGVAAHQNN